DPGQMQGGSAHRANSSRRASRDAGPTLPAVWAIVRVDRTRGGFLGGPSGGRRAADDPNERTSGMPVTRSELLFLCGGAIAGAVVAKNYDKIKAKAGPLR